MKYAIRKISLGFQLCEVFTEEGFQGKRRYCRPYDLIYKRQELAEAKASDFFERGYPNQEREYIGVINNGEWCGEIANS